MQNTKITNLGPCFDEATPDTFSHETPFENGDVVLGMF